jgi:alcohol dehydrogenase
MKAALIERHGGADALIVRTNVPEPELASGEVLVRVRATSLNHHDIFTRNGMPGIKIPMPMIMGLDIAGEIVALGDGVSDWRIGDRVLADPITRGVGGGLLGETRPGGLAEYCAVPAAQLVRLPDGVDFVAAAALPVAYGTAHRMMIHRGAIRENETVLILGASGGVGTSCVLLAKMLGARVVAVTSSAEKGDKLRALGADEIIDARDDMAKAVYALFGKPHRRTFDGGVDVVVNFTGGDTWVPSLKCLRRGGRLLTCGATAGFTPPEDLRYIWTFELDIRGSNGWTKDDLTSLVELVAEGRLRPAVETTLTLDDAAHGFHLLETRQAFGKIVICP